MVKSKESVEARAKRTFKLGSMSRKVPAKKRLVEVPFDQPVDLNFLPRYFFGLSGF